MPPPQQKFFLAPKCHLKRRLTGLWRIRLGTDTPKLILFPAWNLLYYTFFKQNDNADNTCRQ